MPGTSRIAAAGTAIADLFRSGRTAKTTRTGSKKAAGTPQSADSVKLGEAQSQRANATLYPNKTPGSAKAEDLTTHEDEAPAPESGKIPKSERPTFWGRHPIACWTAATALPASVAAGLLLWGGIEAGEGLEKWGVKHNFDPAVYSQPDYAGSGNGSSSTLPI